MKKCILIILVFLAFLGCSQKEAEVKTPVDVNKSKIQSTVPSDFIPEHLKQAKIEVVKHY